MVDLVIQLSRQIISLLPPSRGQNPDIPTRLDQRLEHSQVYPNNWGNAIALFEESLKAAPQALYCIINGIPKQRGLSSEVWERFVNVVRDAMEEENRVFKIIILVQERPSKLFPLLEDNEKILIDSNE